MIKSILLDMDGVVADFMTPSILWHKEAAARRLAIHCAKDMEDLYPRGEWNTPRVLGMTVAEWWAPIDNYDFWINVPMYPGAREFVEAVNKIAPVTFCTSSSLSPDCAKAKIEWIARHIGSQYPMFIGYRGVSKGLMARPDQLLVDDYSKNVDEYTAAGGPAYLIPRPWAEGSEDYQSAKHVSFLKVDYDTVLNTIQTKVESSKLRRLEHE